MAVFVDCTELSACICLFCFENASCDLHTSSNYHGCVDVGARTVLGASMVVGACAVVGDIKTQW